MKCKICGNEYPAILQDCPFCAAENAREKQDNAESWPEWGDNTPAVKPKNGLHWFPSLLIAAVSCFLLLCILVYSLPNTNPSTWLTATLLYSLVGGLPLAIFYFVWFSLTNNRYGRKVIWKVFTCIQIIFFSLLFLLFPYLVTDMYNTPINPNLFIAIITLIFALILVTPLIKVVHEEAKAKKPAPAQVKHGSSVIPSNNSRAWLLAFLTAGIIIGVVIGASIDPIDRSSTIKYPGNGRSFSVNSVYLNLKKGHVFHAQDRCNVERELLGIDNGSYIEMSEYEAILRGFERCPNCYEYALSSDVISIEYSVDRIESTLDDLVEALGLYE